MDMDPPTNAPHDPLQFDRIEPLSSGTGGATCAHCHRSIVTTYYAIGDKTICETCSQAVFAAFQGGFRLVRFSKALLAGLIAAIICAAGWLAIVKLTGYVFGLIAVVVGVVVGIAVRKGASGRGGWLYQGLAVVLTYLAIASSYVPDIISAMCENEAEMESALIKSDKERSRIAICRDGSVKLNDELSSPEEVGKEMQRLKSVDGFAMYYREGRGELAPPASADMIAQKWRELGLPVVCCSNSDFQKVDREAISFAGATVRGKCLLIVLALYVAIQVPFFNLQSHPISLLIIGFALWEAWKINKRVLINFTGPHLLNPQAASAANPNERIPPSRGDASNG